MLDLSLNLKKNTEMKLRKIFDRYSDKEQFAQNIIEYEIAETKKGIVNIQIDLKEFENKYKISSENFYEKFETGKLGDDEDYIIWAGVYEMLIQNEKRLSELE